MPRKFTPKFPEVSDLASLVPEEARPEFIAKLIRQTISNVQADRQVKGDNGTLYYVEAETLEMFADLIDPVVASTTR